LSSVGDSPRYGSEPNKPVVLVLTELSTDESHVPTGNDTQALNDAPPTYDTGAEVPHRTIDLSGNWLVEEKYTDGKMWVGMMSLTMTSSSTFSGSGARGLQGGSSQIVFAVTDGRLLSGDGVEWVVESVGCGGRWKSTGEISSDGQAITARRPQIDGWSATYRRFDRTDLECRHQ